MIKHTKSLERKIIISFGFIAFAILFFGSRQTRQEKYHVYPDQIIKGIEENRNKVKGN